MGGGLENLMEAENRAATKQQVKYEKSALEVKNERKPKNVTALKPWKSTLGNGDSEVASGVRAMIARMQAHNAR